MTTKNASSSQRETDFRQGQEYFEAQINSYRQRMAKLARHASATTTPFVNEEKLKIFDTALEKNIAQQKQVLLDIIAAYESLKLLEKQQYDSGKKPNARTPKKIQLEDLRNDKVEQLIQLSHLAQNIVTQKNQHIDKLKHQYQHDLLLLSQKELLDFIMRLCSQKEFGSDAGILKMKLYLTTPSSLSCPKKLGALVNIAVKNRAHISQDKLRYFYDVVANTRFATQAEIEVSLASLKKHFPEVKTTHTHSLFGQTTKPATASTNPTPTRRPGSPT